MRNESGYCGLDVDSPTGPTHPGAHHLQWGGTPGSDPKFGGLLFMKRGRETTTNKQPWQRCKLFIVITTHLSHLTAASSTWQPRRTFLPTSPWDIPIPGILQPQLLEGVFLRSNRNSSILHSSVATELTSQVSQIPTHLLHISVHEKLKLLLTRYLLLPEASSLSGWVEEKIIVASKHLPNQSSGDSLHVSWHQSVGSPSARWSQDIWGAEPQSYGTDISKDFIQREGRIMASPNLSNP